mgnify:CR=1 FL=1
MMKYLVVFLFLVLLIGGLTACENVRQSIGISTNPFSEKVNEKTKINYKLIFGKVRSKKTEEDDD